MKIVTWSWGGSEKGGGTVCMCVCMEGGGVWIGVVVVKG